MKKIHIILLYTKGISRPENTLIYSLAKQGFNLPTDSFTVSFSEIENEHGEKLKEVYKCEKLNYSDYDYFFGFDLDYLAIQQDKIKDLIVSFIKGEVHCLNYPFLLGVKKGRFYVIEVKPNIKPHFDGIEYLDCKTLSDENLSKVKSIFSQEKLLFLDFYIQCGKQRVFTDITKPRLLCPFVYDYLCFGKDSPIYSNVNFLEDRSLITDILDEESSYDYFLVRFTKLFSNKPISSEIEIKKPQITCCVREENSIYACGSRIDIFRHIFATDKGKQFFGK